MLDLVSRKMFILMNLGRGIIGFPLDYINKVYLSLYLTIWPSLNQASSRTAATFFLPRSASDFNFCTLVTLIFFSVLYVFIPENIDLVEI